MTSEYWDNLQSMREKYQVELGLEKQGMDAFLYLRKLLEPHWANEAMSTHPMRSWLEVMGRGIDTVLIGLAKKLRALEGVEGFSPIIRRLANPKEYASAEAEIETALRFLLAGFDVAFLKSTSEEPTPDILVIRKEDRVLVEVTSVNPPEKEWRGMSLSGEIFRTLSDRMTVGGGFLCRLPSLREIEEFGRRLEVAREQSLADNRVVKEYFPGLGLVFVAPKEKACELPSEYRGSFLLQTRTPKSKIEKIAQKVEKKGKRQCSASEASMLVIYDRLLSPEEMGKILEDKRNDEVALGVDSFPGMLAAVLVMPWAWHSYECLPTENQMDSDRLYLFNKLPHDSKESVILWKNRHSNKRLTEDIVTAFADYPRLVSALIAEPWRI